MKKNIPYTNSNYQLQKLKDNNLIVEDDRFASEMLSMNGYSNLIKSYRDPYILISEGKKTYRTGVTFNQIFSLYLLISLIYFNIAKQSIRINTPITIVRTFNCNIYIVPKIIPIIGPAIFFFFVNE